jgi:hypothetical protein
MLDFGHYGGNRLAMTSLDCVSNAARITVRLGDYLGGIGLDAYQGAAHKAVWKCTKGDQPAMRPDVIVAENAPGTNL